MAGLFRWGSKVCALLALAVLAFGACRKESLPAPSGSSSAASAASASGASGASSASSPPRANVDVDACSRWTVEEPERGTARGTLEVWCERFGPCPENPTAALSVYPSFSAQVRSTDDRIVISWAKPAIRAYVFDRQGRLIGAQNSSDTPNGDCAKAPVFRYVAGVSEPPEVGIQSCGYVPGRDLLTGPACRCKRPVGPTLASDPSRKAIKTSLSCLYEFGVAGGTCRATLAKMREKGALYKFEMSERSGACNRTHVSFAEQGLPAVCVYEKDGSLAELFWGKQYVSETFHAPCAG